MIKYTLFLMTLIGGITLSGCYQIHSDDDLRTIPVTNNPHIVPQRGPNVQSAPM